MEYRVRSGESLLDLTERTITGVVLVNALNTVIAVRGVLVLIRCDNGPGLIRSKTAAA